jgi:rubrerythrin
MESIHQKAIVTAITIETRSLNYCRAVMSMVINTTTRRLFELLSHKEAEHVGSLCHLYTGSADELATILNTSSMYDDPYCLSLLKSIEGGFQEYEALRIARREEQACIELYSVFVDIFREPHVRDVFVRILNEANNNVGMITEEYERLMNVVPGTARDCLCE